MARPHSALSSPRGRGIIPLPLSVERGFVKNAWTIPVLGLTGSIGSGKTEVGRILAGLGGLVIDADGLLRQVIRKGRPAYREIVKHFGAAVLDGRGAVSRRKLGAEVFEASGKRALLESITHGEIMREADRRIRRAAGRGFRPAFLEAALLVETGLHAVLDGLIVVVCDEDVQVKRLQHSRGMSLEDISRRMGAQMPPSKKAEAADWVIENRGDLHELRRRTAEVWKLIEKSRPYLEKKRAWTVTRS
jgi:dephospho-CoA kinase